MLKSVMSGIKSLFEFFGLNEAEAAKAVRKRRRMARSERLWLFWDRSRRKPRPRLTAARVAAWRRSQLAGAERFALARLKAITQARAELGRHKVKPAELDVIMLRNSGLLAS